MTVYVDDMEAPFGRMKMCHLLADTDEELHEMAEKIGVARKWHQAPPKHDSHYDIAKTKKALALEHGAVAITWKQAGAMNGVRNLTGELGKPETAVQILYDFYRERREAKARLDAGDFS